MSPLPTMHTIKMACRREAITVSTGGAGLGDLTGWLVLSCLKSVV